MEPVQHRIHTPRKKNTARTNIILSIVFHVILVVIGGLWAAHEGMLGEKLKNLSATILDKEKKAEVKKEAPKEEVKKVEQPKIADVVKAAAAPPPPAPFVAPAAAGVAAPPPVVIGGGDFAFNQDALAGDPVIHYKQSVEGTLRGRWERPTDIDDSTFVVEVELAVDSAGKVLGHDWKKGSGDKRWDDSVRKALASTKAFSRPPPSGFPEKVLVRFDTEAAKTEPLLDAAVK